ncbi:hypothetical protein EPUS_00949 [Endocarpon pusillum Z07020]|uniref:Uncharacterized protein n=1 Tax=Endocarpon pusillum (strain Z07020 / HMAS-L-300199) TaxID=1263415 RepID=U1HT18_ENDPU|nr:uncharacterized protein EPUS_00949 [Endocarpon pusillum Z07020]ERF73695.1 hypothetical protein EPUS_00949 [Endocarpon pusillum Z07020]
MPFVVLQKFSSPSPGHRPKYEKGWTYVERRPTRRTELCRTIRSRAPSPEPCPSRSLCIGDHYHWHNHHCHSDHPVIIPRSPRCGPSLPPCAPTSPPPPAPPPAPPAPPAPPPTPPSKPKEKPATDPAIAAAAAETARCRAKVIEAYEAAENRRREAEEMDQKIERGLRERVPPPLSRPLSPYPRAERDWERQRERERERERERDRRYHHHHHHHHRNHHHHPSLVSRIPPPSFSSSSSSASSTSSSYSYERFRYRSPPPGPCPILRRRTSLNPGFGCRRGLCSDLRGDRCRVMEPVGSRGHCYKTVEYYDPYYDADVVERVPGRC